MANNGLPSVRVGDIADATISTNLQRWSYESWSSTPMRHFTVTGAPPLFSLIAATTSLTSSGSSMSAAPKAPLPATFGEGHPQLRLISS